MLLVRFFFYPDHYCKIQNIIQIAINYLVIIHSVIIIIIIIIIIIL